MAARLHDIANSTSSDFDVILRVFNDEMMAPQAEPVSQQQQQIQPEKKEE